MEKIYDYTIKLIRYVLKGDVPSLPENIDFERLYTFGKSHGVENMMYAALRDLKIDVPKNVMQKFYYSYLMSIKIDTLQTMELEKIGNAFEEAGIDYIPLKGSVVKHFYPMTHYRKSGDIDVLIHSGDQEKARKILENIGYKFNYICEKYDVHFRFTKEPFLCLEVHRKLIKQDNRAYSFLSEVWNYAAVCDESNHKYELDINFLYVHLIAHIAKHLYNGGAGLRLFTDIWIFQIKKLIDSEKVKDYLKEANLLEIENYIVKLINRWFHGEKIIDDVLDTLELFVFKGGSFGTINQKINLAAMGEKDYSKFKKNFWKAKFLKYIFEPYAYMKQKYPILINHSWLLPVMWIYRLVLIPFKEMEKVKHKFNEYSTNKDSEIYDLNKIYEIIK